MITNMIGYPDYIMNNSALEEKYSDLFAEENSYFANSVRFNKVSTWSLYYIGAIYCQIFMSLGN